MKLSWPRRQLSGTSPLLGHLISGGVYMKRFSVAVISLIILAAISVWAAPNANTAKAPAFPGILANARYVYVASYDGDQFKPSLLPEDREAIGAEIGRASCREGG